MLKRVGSIIAFGLIVAVQMETMVSLIRAQDGEMTPVAVETLALPITPRPEECRAEPRSLTFFADDAAYLLATPAASDVETVATPVSYTPVQGTPADTETVNRIIALLTQSLACLNAGDYPRYSSLLTGQAAHDSVRNGIGRGVQYVRAVRAKEGLADYSIERLLDEFVGELRPVPEHQWATLTAVHEVTLLGEGQVAAVVLLSNPGLGDRSLVMLFQQDHGRFLIAEQFGLVYPPPRPATPAARPPGSPPATPLPDDCETEPRPLTCSTDVARARSRHGLLVTMTASTGDAAGGSTGGGCGSYTVAHRWGA